MTPPTPQFTRDAMPPVGWGQYRRRGVILACRIVGPFEVLGRDGRLTRCPDGFLVPGAGGWPTAVPVTDFVLVYEAVPTVGEETVDGTARWLAEKSGSPRYAGERWRTVLDSAANVGHAAVAAIRNGTSAEVVAAARDRLLASMRDGV